MSKLYPLALCSITLLCMTPVSNAMDTMKEKDRLMPMNRMDTNHDQMISKAEFMQRHEAMWEKLPKEKDGQVMIKDMGAMRHACMEEAHHPKP